MTTIHNEARELYRRVALRHKEGQDPLDHLVLTTLAKIMPMIPERKEGGLHPLHRELILCLQSSIKVDKRSPGETKAFQGIEDVVNLDDVKILKAFMRLPKPKEFDDHLSSRPKQVQRLCNNYSELLGKAEDYFRLNPSKAYGLGLRPKGVPKEPYNWKELVPSVWAEKYDWSGFCQTWPDEAKQVLNGVDLSKQIKQCDTTLFDEIAEAAGLEIENPGKWVLANRSDARMKKHADPDVAKHGSTDSVKSAFGN